MSKSFLQDARFAAVVTIPVVALIEILVRAGILAIPNPVALSLIAVLYVGFTRGTRAGLIGAVLTLPYAMYFFSVPGSLARFSGDNATRMVVFAIVAPFLAWMTGLIRMRTLRAHEQGMHEAAARMAEIDRIAFPVEPGDSMLRLMAESLPVMIAYVNADERHVYCNRRYRESYGLGDEQILKRTVREVMGEDEYAAAKPSIDRALSGAATQFERRHRHPDGTVSELTVSYAPHPGEQGRTLGFFIHESEHRPAG